MTFGKYIKKNLCALLISSFALSCTSRNSITPLENQNLSTCIDKPRTAHFGKTIVRDCRGYVADVPYRLVLQLNPENKSQINFSLYSPTARNKPISAEGTIQFDAGCSGFRQNECLDDVADIPETAYSFFLHSQNTNRRYASQIVRALLDTQ
jgi:hypothetical protein